jgi:hypothetical protein
MRLPCPGAGAAVAAGDPIGWRLAPQPIPTILANAPGTMPGIAPIRAFALW